MIHKFGKDKTEHIIQQSLQTINNNNNNIKKTYYKPPATCSVSIGLGGVK